MRLRNSITRIFVAGILSSAAQLPNPLNFNTAINSANTGTITMLSNDLNWTASLTSSLGPYVSAVACQNPGWSASPNSLANWVTFPHNCSGSPAEHACLGNIDVYYKLDLTLPSTICNTTSISSPGAYCLAMDFFGDNCVSAVYVNGVLNYTTSVSSPYGYTGFNLQNGVSLSMCDNWQPGVNSILVLVKSGAPTYPGWEGFLAVVNTASTTNNPSPIVASISGTNVSCFGMSNGVATITPFTFSGPFSYTWSPTGGNSSSAFGLSPGTYTCYITGNSSSCPLTKTITISQPPSSSLTVSASSPTACVNSSIQLTGSMSGGTPGYTYSWTPGIGTQSTSQTTQQAGGIYIYTLTTKDAANCFKSSTLALNFINQPSLTISGKLDYCKNELIKLTGSGATTYTWNTVGINPTFSTTATSSTFYTLVASNGTCTATKVILVNVSDCTGITEGERLSGFQIFPNPASDKIIILHSEAKLEIQVFDLTGKCVITAQSSGSRTVINLLDLQKGYYILKCSGAEDSFTKTILKD